LGLMPLAPLEPLRPLPDTPAPIRPALAPQVSGTAQVYQSRAAATPPVKPVVDCDCDK
jgi:hypothetical protein